MVEAVEVVEEMLEKASRQPGGGAETRSKHEIRNRSLEVVTKLCGTDIFASFLLQNR